MAILSWFESYGDDNFMGFNMSLLSRDECFAQISNTLFPTVFLYSKLDECIGCAFEYTGISALKNVPIVVKINTKLATKYKILYKLVLPNSPEDSVESTITTIKEPSFGEFGVYNFKIDRTMYGVETLKEPVNIYFPMLTVFLIYFGLFLLISIGRFIWANYQRVDVHHEPKINAREKPRIKSLDTFRGISLVLMIFVNYGCGGYTILEHTVWDGIHMADLLFPWFLWIMGACIPISLKSLQKQGKSRVKIFLSIFKRSCILFVLGLFLAGGSILDTMRIFGVLQRFSIAYFVTASLEMFVVNADLGEKKISELKKLIQVMQLPMQLIFLCIVVFHTLLIFLVEVPDCPRGYLGPGGRHENGLYAKCTGGVAGYVDNLILGQNHIFKYLSIVSIYNAPDFDPEGILGCLTTIYQVFLGVQAGMIILIYNKHKQRIIGWLIWTVITGAAAAILAVPGYIPFNQNLWSLSYVFATSSMAFLLLLIIYVIIDVFKCWTGKPFLFAGMNSILLYVGHSMVDSNFPIHWHLSFEQTNWTHFWTLIHNVWATGCWVLISYLLYRKKFFLSI